MHVLALVRNYLTVSFLPAAKCDNLPVQIKGACLIPKRTCDVMKGEVNRMMVLNKDSVVPVSFTILRRVCIMYWPNISVKSTNLILQNLSQIIAHFFT